MFATLFFDEARANTSVLARQRPDDDVDEKTSSLIPYAEGSVSRSENRVGRTATQETSSVTYTPPAHVPSYVYQSFTCHGSEPIPELRATLFWWLDDNRDGDASRSAAPSLSSSPRGALFVHLMLVDDSDSAREAHHSQSRLLTVELPITGGRQALLTCGVSRLAVGGHCVAVAWMSRDLQAGFLRVTLQRNVNRASTLLLTPQGGVVQAEPLESLVRTFRHEVLQIVQAQTAHASRAVVGSNQAGAASSGTEFSTEHWMLVSGCVVATVPVEERRAMAFFVLTSGVSVWRVQLYEDGSTVLASLVDPKHHHDTAVLLGRQLTADNSLSLADDVAETSPTRTPPAAAETSPTASPAGSHTNWLARWVRGDGRRGGTVLAARDAASGPHHAPHLRRYLTVSAVSGSAYLSLVRSSGHIELLTAADFRLVECYAICRVPAEQARSLHRAAHTAEVVQQWAALDHAGRCVHMLTCLGTQDNRRCIRSMVPAVVPNVDNQLAVAVQCSYGLVPPTTMSSPISAAVDASGRRLLVLWDTGIEEDAHLVNLHSTMSLADASSTGRARCLAQVIETELTPLGALALCRTSAFICHGAGAVQVALAQENSFVVINKYRASHAAYVLQPAAHPLAALVEGALIGNDNESDPIAWPTPALLAAAATRGTGTAAALSFVPTMEGPVPMSIDGDEAASASPYEGFCEGMTVLNSSPQAANLLAALLEGLLTKLTAQTQLASLPQIISEAYLCGYTPSSPITRAAIAAAVKLALAVQFDEVPSQALPVAPPVLESTPYSLFCRFGRLYLQQRVAHDLRQRIVFVAVTMLGEASARAGESHADGTAALLMATLTQLLAAYHATMVAGPELTHVLDGIHEDVVESLLSFLLFPYDGLAAVWATQTEAGRERVRALAPSRVAVRVAARLARCQTPRCTKACLAWCVLLKPLYPILCHFDVMLDLEVGRTANSTHILAATMRVTEALAQMPLTDALAVLIDDGLLLTDGQHSTCFSGVPTSEVVQCLHASPALVPKLYAAGVLRRATPNGSLQAALSESVVRSFFLSELYQVWRVVRAANRSTDTASSTATTADAPTDGTTTTTAAAAAAAAAAPASRGLSALRTAPLPILQLALEELRIDALFCLALASLDRGALDMAFHDLQSAIDAALQLGIANAYRDVVHHVVHQAVEVACASPAGVHALTVVSVESPQLRDLVVHRWYNYIARLPTKSASATTEARRFRAIMGLHRFLMNQHAYAQCGRIMTDLATLLRCSPLRMATSATTHLSVGELANMALSAVELIDPVAPVTALVRGAAVNEEAEIGATSPTTTSALFGSPISLGHSWAALSVPGVGQPPLHGTHDVSTGVAPGIGVGQRCWLSRADIPMLQRRVYQAHCERKLWARGSTLNCTDIWVDGARPADFERGVQRLVEALMQHRLWEEAHRLLTLACCGDPCWVLTEWVKDLLEQRQHMAQAHARGVRAFEEAEEEEEGQEEMRYQWQQLIRACQESATLQNQFRGFCLVVSAALTFDYGATLPMLPHAHCEADAYTSLVTLIEVIEHLRREEKQLRLAAAASPQEEEEAEEGDGESGATSRRRRCTDDAAHVCTTSWLVWQDAVRVATALLRGQSACEVPPGVSIQIGLPTGAQNSAAISWLGFTAGVFDPLARYSKELLSMPASVLTHPSLQDARMQAKEYVDTLAAMH